MNVYALLICLHVVVAISGVGQLGAIALAAREARGAPLGAAGALERSQRVIRYALITMFLTGALLDASAGGAYHGSMWFRASVGLLVLTGIAQARATAALRRAHTASQAFAEVERWSWAACALVALFTVLMEVKPG